MTDNSDLMEDMTVIHEDSSITDMLQLLFSTDEIATKTRIPKPSAIAGLKSFADNLEDIGMKKSAKSLLNLIQYRLELNVSKDGEGRKEFVDAFKSANMNEDPTLSLTEKLTTDLKE